MQAVGVKEVEITVQDIELEAYISLGDGRALQYTNDMPELLHWAAIYESPLL